MPAVTDARPEVVRYSRSFVWWSAGVLVMAGLVLVSEGGSGWAAAGLALVGAVTMIICIVALRRFRLGS